MTIRRALVIGVHPYKSAIFPNIPGAASDANALLQILRERFGFVVDGYIEPLTGDDLRVIRTDFLRKSKDAEVAFVYFAGHGLRLDVNTFLVPSGARIEDVLPRDFLANCLEVNQLVIDFREHVPQAQRIFLFDCCRNDGKGALERAAGGGRLAIEGRALTPLRDELLVHTASLDQRAFDQETAFGTEPSANGAFMRELLPRLRDPERRLFVDILNLTKKAVEVRTEGRQVAAISHGELFDTFYLQREGSIYKSEDTHFKRVQFAQNILSIDVSPSGHRIAVAYGKDRKEGQVGIISTNSKGKTRTATVPAKVYAVDFSPSGDEVAIGRSDGQVGFWAFAEEDAPRSFDVGIKNGAPVNCIEWARKYPWVAAGSADGLVRLLSARGFGLIATGRHWSAVWSLTFHKDGEHFVTGSKDGHLRLWHVAVGHVGADAGFQLEPVGAPIGLDAAVRCVRFSKNGKFLAGGTEGGFISIYEFDGGRQQLSLLHRFKHGRQDRTPHRKQIVERMLAAYVHKTSQSDKKLEALAKANPKEFLDRTCFILSLDFSPDEKVLAYSTSVDGYTLFSLDEKKVVGDIGTYVDYHEEQWPRANALRFSAAHRTLYAAAGRKLHIVRFST